jgi:dolichol-phosphate mannosyltransferase
MIIYVLLPAYNEALDLPSLFDSLVILSKDISDKLKIYVVDDGSKDDTYKAAISFKDKLSLEVIKHEHNKGLGEALRTGIGAIAKAMTDDDILVIMDADNSHSPKYIPSLLSKLKDGFDVVIASRFAEGGMTYGVPFYRRLTTLIASLIFRIFFPQSKVNDFTCGYRAYTGQCIHKVLDRYKDKLITNSSFSAMTEICLKILQIGGKISEIPFELHYENKKGKSKMPFTRTVFNILKLILTIKFGKG